MKPFLRRTNRGQFAPVGWVAEPFGRWGGHEVDVVYDPKRHELLRTGVGFGDKSRTALAQAGFRRMASDEQQELWIRQRRQTTATTAALDRFDQRHGRQIQCDQTSGLGL